MTSCSRSFCRRFSPGKVRRDYFRVMRSSIIMRSLPLVVDEEMAMEEDAAVFFEVGAGDGFAAGTVGFERRSPQDDVLAIEGAVALANGHGGLAGVEPDGGEAVGFGIEAGDAGAGAFGPVRIEEGEVGLQEFAVLDHELFALAFGDDGLSVRGEEAFNDVPVAHKLREEFLPGAGRVGRLVLIVGLLRSGEGGDEEGGGDDPFLHSGR